MLYAFEQAKGVKLNKYNANKKCSIYDFYFKASEYNDEKLAGDFETPANCRSIYVYVHIELNDLNYDSVNCFRFCVFATFVVIALVLCSLPTFVEWVKP